MSKQVVIENCGLCLQAFEPDAEQLIICNSCRLEEEPLNADWKQHLKDYREFMQWDEELTTDYDSMTQEEARTALKNDLEFIIGTNGYQELYETEREYMRLLGMLEE